MESVLAELRPNIKKAVLSKLLIVLTYALIIVGIIFLLSLFIDFGVFKVVGSTLSEFGFQLNASAIVVPAVLFGVLGILAFIFVQNFNLGNANYIFYKDKLKSGAFDIPYNNIVKITFEKKPILNTGDITIDLTGMEKQSITLHFIDETEKTASHILNLINNYKANYYTQKSEEYKYDKILNREAF